MLNGASCSQLRKHLSTHFTITQLKTRSEQQTLCCKMAFQMIIKNTDAKKNIIMS